MDREIGLLVPAVTRQWEEDLGRVKVPDSHQVVDGGGGQEVAAAAVDVLQGGQELLRDAMLRGIIEPVRAPRAATQVHTKVHVGLWEREDDVFSPPLPYSFVFISVSLTKSCMTFIHSSHGHSYYLI